MDINQAINIVSEAASLAPLTKQAHINIEGALNTIREYVKDKVEESKEVEKIVKKVSK